MSLGSVPRAVHAQLESLKSGGMALQLLPEVHCCNVQGRLVQSRLVRLYVTVVFFGTVALVIARQPSIACMGQGMFYLGDGYVNMA